MCAAESQTKAGIPYHSTLLGGANMLTRAQSQPLETSAAWFTVTLSPSESQQYLLKEDGKQPLPPCVEYLSEPASEVASPLLAHKAS